MHVGLVTACYEPVINGVTRMVCQYKERLVREGHQVTVFTFGDRTQDDLEMGIIRSPAIPLGSTGYYLAPRYSKEAQLRIREVDIIHCHHLFMGLELAHRYCRCPVVFTNHSRYDLYLESYSPLSQPMSDAVMRQIWPAFTNLCDLVIAPSESARDVLLGFGVRRPVEVVANGIDLGMFNEAKEQAAERALDVQDDSLTVIYVGRLSAEKNLGALLKEFADARQLEPRLNLTVVGDGPSRDSLQRLSEDLEIGECITFIGLVAPSDVPHLLAAADIFATCSKSEVHPLTIIEALSTGLPVVAIASPGITDCVEDESTGLLAPDSPGELARRLVALARSSERLREMSQEAKKSSERFAIETTISRTLKIYRRLLRERPDISRRARSWHGGTLEQIRQRQLQTTWPYTKKRDSGKYEQ
jgi:glycosyltransferase involved in cell wall biosynthesis